MKPTREGLIPLIMITCHSCSGQFSWEPDPTVRKVRCVKGLGDTCPVAKMAVEEKLPKVLPTREELLAMIPSVTTEEITNG
jgi:hypothetical protein